MKKTKLTKVERCIIYLACEMSKNPYNKPQTLKEVMDILGYEKGETKNK